MFYVKRDGVRLPNLATPAGLIFAFLIAGSAQAQFTAFNDCVLDPGLIAAGTDPEGQSVHYTAANVTDFGIGQVSTDSVTYTSATQYPDTTGTLLNQADGTSTGVTATFTQNTAVRTVHWQPQVAATFTGGYDPAPGTDAHTIFNGIADMTGVMYYGGVGWWIDLQLSGLDLTKTYTFVTSASRARAFTEGPPGYVNRNTLYTLSGSEAATNNSSIGVTESGGNPLTLIMNTGNNHADGRVIRWDDIAPGADGIITIRAESEGAINQAYSFDVFMLEEFAAGGACGNGTLDAGEDCDIGASNGTPGQCCSATCSFESAATECRASAGACDVAEICSGSSGLCPVDAVEPATTECRVSAGFCDLAESCTGVDAACPADAFKASTVGCRGQTASCDAQENCTGSDALCPPDGFQPATAVCRPQLFACDLEELCTGTGRFCPRDETLNIGDPCNDGDACTLDTECLVGLVCGAGGPLDCDDGNVCTADSCDSVTGCGHSLLDCDDGNACTADSCDSVIGCGHSLIPNCTAPLPAASNWGLALLALILVMGGALLLGRRRVATDR